CRRDGGGGRGGDRRHRGSGELRHRRGGGGWRLLGVGGVVAAGGHGERSNQQQCRSPSMHPLIVAPAGLRGEVGFTPPRIRRLPPSIVARLIRTVVGMTTELLPPPVIAPAHTRPAARAVAASKRYGKGDTAV